MSMTSLSYDHFDPDEVLPKNSPLLAPLKPKLRPPTPPFGSLGDCRPSPPSPANRRSRSGNRRTKRVQPSQGDALLVGLLGGGQRPDIAFQAGQEVLPPVSESEDEEDSSTSSFSPRADGHFGTPQIDLGHGSPRGAPSGSNSDNLNMPPSVTQRGVTQGISDLTSLAAGALAKIVTEPIQEEAEPPPPARERNFVPQDIGRRNLDVSLPPPIRRVDSGLHDDRSSQPSPSSAYSPSSYYTSHGPSHAHISRMELSSSNRNGLHTLPEGLPPIQRASPRSDSNAHTQLPSIREHLRDIDKLAHDHAEKEAFRRPSFGQPPPGPFPRLGRLQSHHGSPPISPVDSFRQEMPSPGFVGSQAPSPNFVYSPNNAPRPHDYASSSTETPGSTDQSGSTPSARSDRMSIDGMNNPSGSYICKYQGCTAPPFPTQYLLNSHANVHSSARPHYCPMKGCPRGEGGKGFKRKNEMIRHGLVHDSPGYVCPFCPDREHKYPRPDNLQRHVKVHHVDKDKDDPQLRDVLAQRPGGPSRGRRRTGT